MKLLFLVSFAITLGSLTLKAQTNGKFFADTCYWYVYDWNYTGNPMISPPTYRHEYQKVQGDTIYNGKVHQKVYRKTFSSAQNINPANFNFYGYYLNDSGKVYLGTTLGGLNLTYNFNLAVGDSFLFNGYTGTLNTASNFYVKVNTVDSVFLGSKWRKRISFVNTNYVGSPPYENVVIRWVEGIGNPSYGPIHTLADIQTFKGIGNIYLNCFTENFDPVIGICNFVGLEEQDHLDKSFVLFPNPASDIIHIEQNNTGQKTNEVVLINSYGADYKLSLNDKNEIDISTLADGFYFIRVKTETGFATKKIIVQH